MIGRSLASAIALKCASAISADCPKVNGPGGNTSNADAPPSAAIRAIRAASKLPSAYTPCTSGNPTASPTAIPKITERLVKAGYTEAQLTNFWGGNALRVLGKAHEARKKT